MMINFELLSEKYSIGIETLKDITQELQTPGHDPRDDLEPPKFSSNVTDIKNLAIGDMLEGVVRNITDFGAFVDIGLHNDGLVHKSQMADRFVTHPMDVVSLGQQLQLRVIAIDLEREKVSLSIKSSDSSSNHPSRDPLIVRPHTQFAQPFPKAQKPDLISGDSSITSHIKRG